MLFPDDIKLSERIGNTFIGDLVSVAAAGSDPGSTEDSAAGSSVGFADSSAVGSTEGIATFFRWLCCGLHNRFYGKN